MSKVLIVDDHPAIRMAVKMLLKNAGITDLLEADNGVDALKIINNENIDIVILDLNIPQLDGMEVLHRTIKNKPEIKSLILTTHTSDHFALRCLQMGATGFVSKNEDLTNIVTATKAILSGHNYFPASTLAHSRSRKITNEEQLVQTLSDRELMVLQQLSQGFSNKEIAEKMLLSNKTISTYKARIIEKIGVKSIIDLTNFSKRNGLI
ncbi:response regulator transcription factor [Vibrio aphrogenes]|uniref:response regulator transcription factor n=1 Tax=Vibrio aphrogenes TaxID=1891186 RepID=UPI000B35C846|nr:response regulator transcription factor [Vibrio aphrogenes]